MEDERIDRKSWELPAVEGMVVVVIIGMILLIAVPQYRQLRQKRTIDRARQTCLQIWRAETEYIARYNAFKDLKGAAEIEAPMPEGLGIRLDSTLPFYFAAMDSTVVALGIDRMMGASVAYTPGRKPQWQIVWR